jgi:diketogulonate reductase-like aldo/keto reductase
MNVLKINENLQIPSLGFGTYRASGDALVRAVKLAIMSGYRYIDCAWLYNNEEKVGQGIKEAIQESNGSIKRENLFIVSKLWSTFHSKDMVKKGLNESLNKLQLEYLDLFLIHWPMGYKENTAEALPEDSNKDLIDSGVCYVETWKAMEELMKEGRVKNIGVSNFSIKQLQDIMESCEIKPVTNQIEVHPYLQEDKLVEFCQNNNILVTAYGIIGGGEKSTDPSVPALLENETLIRIGKKYNKTPAQVCLRWGIQKGFAVLAKSITPCRIVENYQIFDFELSDEDMTEIKKINKNMRLIAGIERFKKHPLYPYTE